MEQIFKMGPLQKRWLRRLKAHPERQTENILGKQLLAGGYQACCLGEAGLMLGSCSFNEYGKLQESSGDETSLVNSFKELGLRDELGSSTDDDNGSYVALSSLNDDNFHTWVDIAYLIEAAPELFFTEPK